MMTTDPTQKPLEVPFVCPHCGLWQIRRWAHKDGPNYCNQCQQDMGPALPRDAIAKTEGRPDADA
jgi:hypothetical protein